MLNRSIHSIYLTLLLVGCAFKQEKADMVVHNAVIHTMDQANTIHQAMAIRDGSIVEMGPERAILNKYAALSSYDAAGQHVFPGFIDGHCHFYGLGLDRGKVDLIGTSDWDDALQRTQAYASTNPGNGWILGRGWDQNDWADQTEPDNDLLNELFPDRPVLLQRIDGHAAVVNQTGLDHAHLKAGTSVEGGLMVERDGRPTGLLIDNAVNVFSTVMNEADETTKRRALLTAQEEAFGVGLTMVCDAGLDVATIELIRTMQAEGQLKIRVYAMVSDSEEALEHFARAGKILEDRLIVRAIKIYGDGAMGSRGALLKDDYHDRPGHKGFQLATTEHFRSVAKWCDSHDFQMAVHCIGDSANKLLLDVYGEVLQGTNDKRWRIEHAQVVDPNDIEKFAAYSIIPSVQPTHATSDGPWAETRLGAERIDHAYAYRALLGQLGMVALGTDAPVEPLDPMGTFRSAVLRQDPQGWPDGGYRADQALSAQETVMGMTIWNAVATFTEDRLGSLEVGKAADLVVMDGNLLRADTRIGSEATVTATFVAGERVR